MSESGRFAWPARRRQPARSHVAAAAIAVVSVVACALPAATAAAAGSAATERTESKSGRGAPASLADLPEAARAKAQVHDVLADPQFADTFAGAVREDDGSLTIYATGSRGAAFAGAVEHAAGPAGPSTFRIRPARVSYAALKALTARISADRRSLEESGLQLVMWGPEPTTNSVQVEIAAYTTAKADLLTRRYGSSVTVVPALDSAPLQAVANRYDDIPKFFNGVVTFADPETKERICTHGYAYRGNKSGLVFGMTAGHCVKDRPDIFTNLFSPWDMGGWTVSYLERELDNKWDIATFNCDERCSTGGLTWYEGQDIDPDDDGRTRYVVAICSWCETRGELVAADGAHHGEMPNNKVLLTDKCRDVFAYGQKYEVCHLTIVENQNDRNACYWGDSGGPVYQRTSNNKAFAAGVIVAFQTAAPTICVFHPIGGVLNRVNGTLLTY